MPELTPEQKAQLDKNIRGMLSQGASESDVNAYVSDFKSKYDVKKKESSVVSADAGAGFGGGIPETSPSTSPLKSTSGGEIYKPESVEVYNRRFEELTGHKEFDLSAPQSATNILDTDKAAKKKKDYEEKKYLINRNIKTNEISPVIGNVQSGKTNSQELSNLYNKPYGKKIVGEIINNTVPELGSTALESDVFGNEQKWDDISRGINVKNRANGVDSQNKYFSELDADITNSLLGAEMQKVSVSGGTGGGAASVSKTKFSLIDTNDAKRLGEIFSQIESADMLIGSDGNAIDKKALLEKIAQKQFYLSAKKPIDEEILSIEPAIKSAIRANNLATERGEQNPSLEKTSEQWDINQKHFELGLNHIKDAQPGQYKIVLKAIKERGLVSDTDYEQLAGIGQDIYNQQVFEGGATNPELIGKETNLKYESYQTKKANYAKVLSEEIKSLGYKNTAKVSEKAIDAAASRHPELTNKSVIEDIKLDEANGGYGIVKGGGITAFFRGVAAPIKGINSTVNAIIESPVDNYLNSKKLDYGDQKIADKKGQYSGELPSERGNIFNDILEGAGQFIPQVILAKGIGNIVKTPINSALGRISPRVVLTAGQEANIAAYPGTFISTFIQSYGDGYTDMLQKTGDPDTARLVGAIDGTSSALFEMILPDTKIADNAALLFSKKNLAKDILGVIKSGGSSKEAKPFIKEFVKNLINVSGQEVLEEDGTAYVDYFTEAIFSPATIKDRDLAKELWETTKQTALSMVIPAVLGGGGSAKQNQQFTKQGLHTAAINFDEYKENLDKALGDKNIQQKDYNDAIKALTTHRESISTSPKENAAGQNIPYDKRLEYAFQETVRKVNQDKADNQKDLVQKEFYEKKAKEADEIKKNIFYGENSSVAPVVAEAVAPAAENKVDVSTENTQQDADNKLEGDIKNSGAVSVFEKEEPLQYFIDQASSDPVEFETRFGGKITNQLLDKVATEQLVEKRAFLIKNFGLTNPTVDYLSDVINQRNETEGKIQPEIIERTPVQVQKMLTESLSFQQKYAPVDLTDPVTGETKKMAAKTAKGIIQKRHDILEKLVNCLT